MKKVYLVFKAGTLVRVYSNKESATKLLFLGKKNRVTDLTISAWEVKTL